MILYKIKYEWENQNYKLTERLEDVSVSVNCVPYCTLCIRLMSGTGSAGRLLLTVAGRLLLTMAGRLLLTVAGKLLLTVAGRLLLTMAGRLLLTVAALGDVYLILTE